MVSANDLVRLATAAAQRGADYLRTVERPRDPATWGSKGNADWVTEVDRTSEELISEVLLGGEPDSRIIGEELSPELVNRGLVWVVDPLDGTTNFLHGVPIFAVSIAAAVDGVLEAGVVLHVPLNRCYRAWKGGGAWLGDQRLSVSTHTEPRHALIGTGFPYSEFTHLDRYLAQFASIVSQAGGIRRAGSAALDLADVAAGRFEAFWEQRLSAWDVAAGTLLVREAGGRVTDFSGRDLGVEHGETAAGSPVMHAWLLSQLWETE
ncbi:MAG: inositol monophosphatase family protein [Gemmatimonadota bacterium]